MTPSTHWFERADVDRLAKITDPHFAKALEAQSAPGIAYGVMLNGELLHFAGIGVSSIKGGQSPHERTAFRIASMTKSFTAATVLNLRDQDALSLDMPVVGFVPELAAGGAAAREITVRHLLTMGGGFLTDDPWGDRQQDLPIDDLRALLASGVTSTLPPGDQFEYSNLGYALLGLVVSAVTGQSYPDAVRTRVLEPLGLSDSGYAATDLATDTVASGYVRRSSGWHEEPIAASGAFSPMGGLLSTVADLARWVGFFQSDGELAQILSPVSLREMQRTQRLIGASAARDAGQPPDVFGYGFGLFEEFHAWGRSVFHSGGYPGFGSHMRWHPASGLAVVALANGTYAPMSTVSVAALADLVTQTDAPVKRPAVDLPGLNAAVDAVRTWLASDDPDGAEGKALRGLWADNVERDLPWDERVAAWEALRREHGSMHQIAGSERRPSPGAVTWDMAPDGATEPVTPCVRVMVMVSPHDQSLVQSVTLRPVPAGQPAPVPVTDVS
ncbi:MAG TPA: serine hydrolase domain-containing protein [Actinomycetes bacterium]|nr:serine hydrolase domain-containing protein [Actinomycetes bacterium]